EVSFRVLRSFFEENREFMDRVAATIGKPMMLELFEDQYAYFIFKGEWNVVDAQKKAGCLGTIQIDVENADRFDIKYIGEDGKEKRPLILHTSPSGSMERILYGVLEQAHKDKGRGKKPKIPLWMTPSQVRLLPVDENMIDYCLEIGQELDKHGVRYEIDDRSQTVGKKVRAAEKLWIPYICVVGEKERESGELSVRRREEGDQSSMNIQDLTKIISDKTKFAPKQRLLLPKLVSKQPVFSREV
ncbi:MAG: His/Gly/Thr/Pro-type tRNA ligase C-terminal domain-containing protein, partial [Candidatus Thorarchaeota archaeon]